MMDKMKKLFSNPQDSWEEEPEVSAVPEMAPAVVEQPEPPRNLAPSSPGTVIGREQTLEGTLRGEGSVRIDGYVVGEITLIGNVIVSATGSIKGPTHAESIRVAGTVEGTLTARNRIRLERTAVVQGDLSCASLIIEDGAHFDGRSVMIAPPPTETTGEEDPLPAEALQFGKNYEPEIEEAE